MTENFIDFDCYVIIDNKPLVEMGWDGGPVSLEMAEKAYGSSSWSSSYCRNKSMLIGYSKAVS